MMTFGAFELADERELIGDRTHLPPMVVVEAVLYYALSSW